jgi:hypothetical protein
LIKISEIFDRREWKFKIQENPTAKLWRDWHRLLLLQRSPPLWYSWDNMLFLKIHEWHVIQLNTGAQGFSEGIDCCAIQYPNCIFRAKLGRWGGERKKGGVK